MFCILNFAHAMILFFVDLIDKNRLITFHKAFLNLYLFLVISPYSVILESRALTDSSFHFRSGIKLLEEQA